jgi:DNA modification methylase
VNNSAFVNHGSRSGKSTDASISDGRRNRRSIWTIPTQPFAGAHFAVFPPALVEPCILAGSREGDTVLDPFAGAGTVGVVCRKHRREFVGIELNEEYAKMARGRLGEETAVESTDEQPALFS